jgi:predicted Zn-dependent protease
MTARSIQRGASREGGHLALWRLALALLVILLIWLILATSAAGQEQKPKFAVEFDPSAFFERFLGKMGAPGDDESLNKVEIAWHEETRLGQQLLDDFRRRVAARKQPLIERGKDVQYLEQLAALIQPQMRQADRYKKLSIHVASLGGPNAYTLPGGHLIFSREMLEQAGSEAAVVCVLGHELAHLDRGHLLRRMKQWKLAQSQFAKPPADFSSDKIFDNLNLMQQLFRQPFHPEQELEADRDGIAWAFRAGYDPRALAQVFEAMQAAGLAAPEFFPAFLRTHPLTADRHENLRAAYAQLRADSPSDRLYLGRENLARRITRAAREFAE